MTLHAINVDLALSGIERSYRGQYENASNKLVYLVGKDLTEVQKQELQVKILEILADSFGPKEI